MLYALGLGDEVVGVTYACDYPPEVKGKPVVVRTRLPETKTSAELDAKVKDFIARQESLYSVDENLLAELRPDLIVTQDLCMVCAASPDDFPAALARLPKEPKVLTLAPTTLQEVWTGLLTIAEATRRLGPAADIVADIKRRMTKVANSVDAAAARPRVACLEWFDPPFAAGHWVPDMVEHAGGVDVLGRRGKPSFEIEWEKVLASEPDLILICPCGYDLEEVVREFRQAELPDGWDRLPAVRAGRVFAVDANSYFSRPSHRLITGVEMLARLIAPNWQEAGIPAGVRRLTD